MEKNGQTVSVLDEQDTVIGHTYPKRAKGLVKNRRAEFVSDKAIRLCRQCPTYENMEDKEMDQINFITLHPKAWRKNPDGADKTVCDHFTINNPLFGAVADAPRMVEVLSLGSFNWGITSYVTNGFQELSPNTEYHLVFWLNGGENDRSDETCQLQILFTDDNITASNSEFEKGMRFRLNRGYIKPLKKYKGWEYYDITFTTPQTRYTQFQFVADRAPMALMDAGEPDLYKDLQDVPDPYEKRRPQRHNIFFEDGWPKDQWYATERLAKRNDGEEENTYGTYGKPFGFQADFKPPKFGSFNWGNWFGTSRNSNIDGTVLKDEIVDKVMENLDLDELQDELQDILKGQIISAVLNQLDKKEITSTIVEQLTKQGDPGSENKGNPSDD